MEEVGSNQDKPKKKYRHSTTVYLPRKFNSFLVRAIKARGEAIFGKAESLGKSSKYIIYLIKKDLIEAGLMTGDVRDPTAARPNEEALEKLEKNSID